DRCHSTYLQAVPVPPINDLAVVVIDEAAGNFRIEVWIELGDLSDHLPEVQLNGERLRGRARAHLERELRIGEDYRHLPPSARTAALCALALLALFRQLPALTQAGKVADRADNSQPRWGTATLRFPVTALVP